MNGQAQGVDTFTEEFDESSTADSADSNEFQGQQEESPPPTPQPEVPYTPPPVQPNYNPQAYDDVPAWVDEAADINSYTKNVLQESWNRFEQEWAAKQLRERVESAEARAREMYNSKNGLPEYGDLITNYALPVLQQQPALRQLVLSQADPAAASYVVGFCARFPHLIPEVMARQGRIDKSIFRSGRSFKPTVSGRNSERRQPPSGKVNYSDWDNESFEAELDRFKMSGE